ncbi:MAG: hypothetical protein AB7N76_01105 [Planctomycetota bacterium]
MSHDAPELRAPDLRELEAALRPHLAPALAPVGGFERLAPSGFARTPTPDAPVLLLALGRGGRPRAVVRCSAPTGELVERELLRSLHAKVRLGPELGEVVLEPLVSLRLAGRAHAVLPLCRPTPRAGLAGLRARLRLRRPLLQWLRAATARTVRAPSEPERARDLRAPLEWLARADGAPRARRAAARAALGRLEGGAWRPRLALCHGDLWLGNVLRWPRAQWWRARPARRPFALIDWAGSPGQGAPGYDLLCLAESLRLTPRRLGAELRALRGLLACTPLDLRGYLLVALGALGLARDHYDPSRAAAHAARLEARLDAALAYV